MKEIRITQIEGFKIGHYTDKINGTGLSVVLAEEGAICGVNVRGGGPATRETDALKSQNIVELVHGIFIAGGSAFGLNAAAGIMQYLEEKNIGFDVGIGKVPIVSGASIFDLAFGKNIRPGAEEGYKACLNAQKNEDLEGNIGAGTGASIGKFWGAEYCMKSGLGSYAVEVGNLKLGALTVVNALGDVFDGERMIGGLLNKEKTALGSTFDAMLESLNREDNLFKGNTSISIILTNAELTKVQVNRLAELGHNGFARAIYPVHTSVDGDSVFAMTQNKVKVNFDILSSLAVEVIRKSIVNAVKKAKASQGLKAYEDFI